MIVTTIITVSMIAAIMETWPVCHRELLAFRKATAKPR